MHKISPCFSDNSGNHFFNSTLRCTAVKLTTFTKHEVFLFRAVIEFQIDPEQRAAVYGVKWQRSCTEDTLKKLER